MKKILLILFLVFGIFNLYNLAESFTPDFNGRLKFLSFDIGLTGYRIKNLAFAFIFFLASLSSYKQMKRKE